MYKRQEWDALLERVHSPAHTVRVGLVGKYVDLPDAYLSVTEALRAGGFANNAKVEIKWIVSDDCETESGAAKNLSDVMQFAFRGDLEFEALKANLVRSSTHGRRRFQLLVSVLVCNAW